MLERTITLRVCSHWEMSDYTKKRVASMTDTEFTEYKSDLYSRLRNAEHERNLYAANMLSYEEEIKLANEIRKANLS